MSQVVLPYAASPRRLRRRRPTASTNSLHSVLVVVASLAILVLVAVSPPCSAFVFPVAQRGAIRSRQRTSRRGGSTTTDVPRGSDDPALEFVDPATNVTVALVGCLHGSRSSSEDVLRALGVTDASGDEDGETTATDVVVLELCAARFADVRNEMRRSRPQLCRSSTSKSAGSDESSSPSLRGEELSDYLDGSESGFEGMRGWAAGVPLFLGAVRRTAEKKGTAAAVAALALGTVAGTQAALSGFEPGREFRVAVECVVEGRGGCGGGHGDGSGAGGADIILADKTVDETLRRVGNLPAVSGGMMRAFLTSPSGGDGRWNARDSYGPVARALSTAVRGDPELLLHDRGGPPRQVDMGRALVRNGAVRTDLARLTVPPLLLAEGVATALNKALDALMGQHFGATDDAIVVAAFSDLSSTLTLADMFSLSSGMLLDAAVSAAVLVLGYIAFVLPTAKLIISERDEALAKGVREACKLAVTKRQRIGDSGDLEHDECDRGRVVAVLGLLHVNGVAQRLLAQD